jgi:hypothetical protein
MQRIRQKRIIPGDVTREVSIKRLSALTDEIKEKYQSRLASKIPVIFYI